MHSPLSIVYAAMLAGMPLQQSTHDAVSSYDLSFISGKWRTENYAPYAQIINENGKIITTQANAPKMCVDYFNFGKNYELRIQSGEEYIIGEYETIYPKLSTDYQQWQDVNSDDNKHYDDAISDNVVILRTTEHYNNQKPDCSGIVSNSVNTLFATIEVDSYTNPTKMQLCYTPESCINLYKIRP